MRDSLKVITFPLLSVLMRESWRNSCNSPRALKEEEIVWGTFRDASGLHVNAHSNNMVLVNEGYSKENQLRVFLAPLDFDMAYTKRSCCFGAGNMSSTYFVVTFD